MISVPHADINFEIDFVVISDDADEEGQALQRDHAHRPNTPTRPNADRPNTPTRPDTRADGHALPAAAATLQREYHESGFDDLIRAATQIMRREVFYLDGHEALPGYPGLQVCFVKPMPSTQFSALMKCSGLAEVLRESLTQAVELAGSIGRRRPELRGGRPAPKPELKREPDVTRTAQLARAGPSPVRAMDTTEW